MKNTERIEMASAAAVVPSVAGAIEPAVYVREMEIPLVPMPVAPRATEQRFRLAAVRLDAILDGRRRDARAMGRLVIITSPESRDGKTTTALHLATALSRSLGRRVALVEIDRSRPGMASMLGLTAVMGLTDVINGAASLDEVLLRGEDAGPILVPGGEPNGRTPPVAAMLSPLNALREYYDYVLCDCPALDDSADAAVLGRAADGVVLVVRAGATRGPSLAGAVEALVDAPLVGCVINDLDGLPGRHAAAPRVVREARMADEDD